MSERITWKRSTGIGRSGWDGFVGGRQLFIIEWSVTQGEGWKLRTRLPFNIAKDKQTARNSGDLMLLSERVLTFFVESLGASFPEESPAIKDAAAKLMGMIETHGRANGPGLWLAATTLDPSLKD